MILDQKLQRMLNDSKIAQLNSERPLHQTAVSHQTSSLEIKKNHNVISIVPLVAFMTLFAEEKKRIILGVSG